MVIEKKVGERLLKLRNKQPRRNSRNKCTVEVKITLCVSVHNAQRKNGN